MYVLCLMTYLMSHVLYVLCISSYILYLMSYILLELHIVAIRRRDGLLTLNCCCTKQPFGQYKRTFVADCCPCGLQGPAQGPQDECSCPRPRRILQRLQDAHSSTRIRFSLGQGQLAGFISLPLLLGKWSPMGAWRTV